MKRKTFLIITTNNSLRNTMTMLNLRSLYVFLFTTVFSLFLMTVAQAATVTDVTQLLNMQQQSANAKPSSTGLPTTSSGSTNGAIPSPTSLLPGMSTTLPTPSASSTTPNIQTGSPQLFDYSTNLKSDVFGGNLFTGAFTREGSTQFNPDYALATGDSVQVRFWGAFEYDATLVVDPKGNIFMPHVGPVHVLGVHNQDLQRVVDSAVSRVFRNNVYSYASLAAAQPVRVFVGGFVNRPGLYSGTSMDSLLHYLDQAGGIDLERGSFLNVQVKRGERVRSTVNLYDFLLQGQMPLIQLADGDVIFVAPRQSIVKVSGLAANAHRFEFSDNARTVADLTDLAKPMADATHVRITRNTGTTKNIEYYPLSQASQVNMENGDQLEFTADKKQGTITVRVQGEHQSPQEYVLPYGSRLGTLLKQIHFTERSDVKSLQLFRLSVKERQRNMLQTALKRLETTVLNARSGTAEESTLRTSEAELVLKWVERAKTAEPSGQVMIAQTEQVNDLLLEAGDIINVPSLDNLVLVNGEVVFPNSIALDPNRDVEDYIRMAGGYSQGADRTRIVIAHRDGSFEDTEEHSGLFSSTKIRPGDEILVMPDVDPKYRQLFKEVSMMVYQMALGARVILK
ncbi:MAG: polysaccharide biosynthesis/export family protein [Methylococcaceae bacterium]